MNRGRRRFLWKGLGSTVALAAGTGLYAWRIEPHWVEFVQRALPIANLPPALAGRTLVQLSDLHVGPRVDDDYVIGVFDRVRALAPDIVVFTGDFTENDRADARRTRGASTRARRSVASRRSASSATTITARAGGIRSWPRTWCPCSPTAGFACCATRWSTSAASTSSASTICGRSGSSPRPRSPIAMRRSRRSSSATIRTRRTRPGWLGYEGWILSGHTHGGQCKPPFLPPPLIPVRNRRYTSGEIDAPGGRRLYISRGVGHTLMVRFNARPEVTVFTLQRA